MNIQESTCVEFYFHNIKELVVLKPPSELKLHEKFQKIG